MQIKYTVDRTETHFSLIVGCEIIFKLMPISQFTAMGVDSVNVTLVLMLKIL